MAGTITRPQARRHIERAFSNAVSRALDGIDMVELRVVVLEGDDERPPATTIICDSMGQLDLGWIETSDAPIAWRSTAYRALELTLGRTLPVFGYQDLFEEIALFYWDGETDDVRARQSMIEIHGADPGDLDEMSLPSTMDARRPEWMLGSSEPPLPLLPPVLQASLARFREAYDALDGCPEDRSAWQLDMQDVYEYLPGIEECSRLPPLTLVPLKQFEREIDDVARYGMELGFMDVAGLCTLDDAAHIARWLKSLRMGADFLRAAQDLINLDPAKL